ncbi:MAG: anhydro-N-acetylmuramic acid kinase [Bacteroidales bacterium]|nr:anhydro-N-acetylmuramic acid kinase [Bacteroidales bacterium]
MEKVYKAIGLMSGTSLDGLDIVLCTFKLRASSWKFSIDKANTIAYSMDWKEKLIQAPKLDGLSLIRLHKAYGRYLGAKVNEFLDDDSDTIDLIASHGHTIFHEPVKKVTFQLGDGNSIAAKTKLTTISDFRSLDVALGGQGAPLVPIGDKLLFANFDFCLNLGGFSNISYNSEGFRVAYDSSPANIVLNYLMNTLGKEYDRNGETGRKGKLHTDLFDRLNQLPYYSESPPKSLGREWMEKEFIPVLDQFSFSIEDKLRTVYEHIAFQICQPIQAFQEGTILVTGGGAHNTFLIEKLREKTKHKIILPENQIIDYKEAIIFAFLGVLSFLGEINCLSSVTGASRDNIGGSIISV